MTPESVPVPVAPVGPYGVLTECPDAASNGVPRKNRGRENACRRNRWHRPRGWQGDADIGGVVFVSGPLNLAPMSSVPPGSQISLPTGHISPEGA